VFLLYHHILNPVNKVVPSPPPISQHQGVEGPVLHHCLARQGRSMIRSRLHRHEVKVRDGERVERTPEAITLMGLARQSAMPQERPQRSFLRFEASITNIRRKK